MVDDTREGVPYCTISVSPTLRVSPALEAATVRLYVPAGVGVAVVPPPSVVAGMMRATLHPASAPQTKTAPNKTAAALSLRTTRTRRRTPNSPSGSSTANHTICRAPGSSIFAPSTLLATVTVIGVVPPSAGFVGLTVQVACAGSGPQVNVTVPGTPAAELSSNAYVALVPAEIVAVVGPLAARAKSTPVPVSCSACGDEVALSATASVPTRAPPAVGAKTTCMVQAAPAARATPRTCSL